MQGWKGWPLERLMYLFLTIAFTVVWAQIYLFHGVMGKFHAEPQYVPVIITPFLVLGALWYTCARSYLVRSVFITLFCIGLLTGLMGMYYHLSGVMGMPGGMTLQNFADGPPVLLPLVYAALSILALAIAAWPVKLTAPDFEREYDQVQTNRRYRGRTPA
jgi:hypothetical protein